MKPWTKKFNKINRILHRDLGYLFIGLTLIYGLSGISVILRHLDIDIAHKTTHINEILPPNLSKTGLYTYWEEHQSELPKLSRVKQNTENTTLLVRVKSGNGTYNPQTGELSIKTLKTNHFVKFVNDIHYNVGGRFSWLALLYSVMLVFFATSGAIIAKGRNSFFSRGVWFTLLGIAIPTIIYFWG